MGTPRQILSTLRVRTLMSVRSESSGPFALGFPAFEHAKVVAVLRGRFDLQIEGEAARTRLRRGDCYMLTSGRPYRISNADVAETDAADLFSAHRGADGVVRWGDGRADTVTLGCRATLTARSAALLRAGLAPVIHIPADAPEAARIRAILSLLLGEDDDAPDATLMGERYFGVLLVQALRHHLRDEPGPSRRG